MARTYRRNEVGELVKRDIHPEPTLCKDVKHILKKREKAKAKQALRLEKEIIPIFKKTFDHYL